MIRGEMSILSEIERIKDIKTRQTRKVIRKYKSANDKNTQVPMIFQVSKRNQSKKCK